MLPAEMKKTVQVCIVTNILGYTAVVHHKNPYYQITVVCISVCQSRAKMLTEELATTVTNTLVQNKVVLRKRQ